MSRPTSRVPAPRSGKAGLLLAAMVSACNPQLVVGKWVCPVPDASFQNLGPIEIPWSTGFETGFCDFDRANSFCYADPGASYSVVDSPVHRGWHAAAFSTNSVPSKNGDQARCVLQGEMPPTAIYGAWFYLPKVANTLGNWNIVHFQGGVPDGWHNLWDISLANNSDGSLSLHLFDGLREMARVPSISRPIPIGAWFHVEFLLAAAKDETGRVALYQDGELLLELTGLATNDSDLTQWYIGNLTSNLNPSEYTLYIDDVTVRAVP